MKKKHRKIRVNGQSYGWTVKNYGKEQTINVWQDKKVIFTSSVRTSGVTPSLVADLIREYQEKHHLIFDDDQ